MNIAWLLVLDKITRNLLFESRFTTDNSKRSKLHPASPITLRQQIYYMYMFVVYYF